MKVASVGDVTVISSKLSLQTPESMKNWVQKLRYIKAYWSKVQVRETIISEEQERKLLEKLLQEEEDEDGVSENYSKS